jgi:hypothetical protein
VAINKDLKERAQKTREDGVFTLKLDEGVSLAMRVSFAQDMFPGVSTEGIGVWPADDGELSVSMRGGGAVVELRAPRRPCARSRYQCGVRRAHPTKGSVGGSCRSHHRAPIGNRAPPDGGCYARSRDRPQHHYLRPRSRRYVHRVPARAEAKRHCTRDRERFWR